MLFIITAGLIMPLSALDILTPAKYSTFFFICYIFNATYIKLSITLSQPVLTLSTAVSFYTSIKVYKWGISSKNVASALNTASLAVLEISTYMVHI